MRAWFHRWSWKVAAAAGVTWVGIHAVAGQHPTHSWYDVLLYAALGLGIVLLLITWEPVANGALWWRRPKLEMLGVGQYFRRARDSQIDNDLQVVYARIRNVRNGGGERATWRDAKAWMSVVDESGRSVGHGCQGNWVNVFAGTPDPKTFNEATFRPNGEQFGLEIAAKFVWSEDAYLAGEVHPNLVPGKYRIRASISDAVHKAVVFEWNVENPGANGELASEGLNPRPTNLTRLSEIATVSSASASQADPASWGATALHPESDIRQGVEGSRGLVITFGRYGVPNQEADVRDRLRELIEDDVLDFEVGSETLLVDPAPGKAKKLRVRWLDHGKPDASQYLDGTHVVIPRSAARGGV